MWRLAGFRALFPHLRPPSSSSSTCCVRDLGLGWGAGRSLGEAASRLRFPGSKDVS